MSNLKLVNKGKVCDIYSDEHFPSVLFFNRTDRFSVGDRVFPGLVKYKGLVLNQMSLKWMRLLEKEGIVENHLVTSTAEVMLQYGLDDSFSGTGIVAWKCIPIPLEAIVRGYYIPESKSWNPYKETGTMYGYLLPAGLKESERLPEAIYTPSTKAGPGEHDRNIDFCESIDVLDKFLTNTFDVSNIDPCIVREWAHTIASNVKRFSLLAYQYAHDLALKKGIILADTKLEFGLMKKPFSDDEWQIVLIDEAFTPDSSRFWDAEIYEVGKPQPSMDKQFIRRYIYNVLKWDGNSEPPEVPTEILSELSRVYTNIYERLFGESVSSIADQIALEWQDALEIIKKDCED